MIWALKYLMLPLTIALLSYVYLSPDSFNSAASGLLTLFSILAGLVAQTMVLTAMLVSPEKLSTEKMTALKESLERQQKFWVKQFQSYMVVCISIFIWMLSIKEWESAIKNESIGKVLMCINIALASYAVINAMSFPNRVLGLQRLRFVVIDDERKIGRM